MTVQCKASMGDDVKSALSTFQSEVGLFREGYKYWENAEVSIRIAQEFMNRYPEFAFLDGWGTPQSILRECDNLDEQNKRHGGKREGSGRKKGLPTENVRLVSALAPGCKQLSDYYKTSSESERQRINIALSDLLADLLPKQ
ncbi:hypothetical protein L1D52_24600 [Vibrio brasiliensis]|uniref:hypothetical protein n=1 Tax=Vibrio brasiliensis TaxID=170652 RepID=UPI001EFE85E7|nr:hypothetical protein [Vibrio brasiliensis]MCG9785483.1 hypothetical protein [Vibrio brasiliensis]